MSSIQVFFVFAMYYLLKLFLFATLEKYTITIFLSKTKLSIFLLGLRIFPRETENNGYAKLGKRESGGGGCLQKDYYGIFSSGGWTFFVICI